MTSIPVILAFIVKVAEAEGVPPRLAQELAIFESNLVEDCIGRTGDLGIMQINPLYIPYFTQRFWDPEVDFNPFNYRHNIVVGIRYLAFIHDSYKFNWWQSIIAYNCGPSIVAIGTSIPMSSIQMANIVFERAAFSHQSFKEPLVEFKPK